MLKPILSIVVPTREGFSQHWIEHLLQVKGEQVEFILVHPSAVCIYPTEDTRLRQLVCPFRGEVIQRLSGLLNAAGTYVLTINCDEYINPSILEITTQYYQRFPDSSVLRLSKQQFEYGDRQSLAAAWPSLVPVDQIEVYNPSIHDKQSKYNYLREIPIAPLSNKLDLLALVRGRKDMHGPHTENFDKKVWKNEKVQPALADITELMTIWKAVKYVPFWCLDRLLGLFVQAKFFKEAGEIIGHELPTPAQIRVEANPPEYKKAMRFYIFAEILLVRKFPQYGYLWNVIFGHLQAIPYRGITFLQRQFKLNFNSAKKLKEKELS